MKIITNGKTFWEIYLNKKYKEEPIKVESWSITNGNMFRAGYFEVDKDCINPSLLELFEG